MNKLDNGSVIFTPEEYGDYLMLQQNYEFACEQKETYRKIAELNTHKLIQFFQTRDEIRKETAKEILQEVASPYYSVGDVYELTRLDIQELATKFGAEVSDE